MALTTLAAVKLHLGISDDADDALLTQLIQQASADIESRCNRTLLREERAAEGVYRRRRSQPAAGSVPCGIRGLGDDERKPRDGL